MGCERIVKKSGQQGGPSEVVDRTHIRVLAAFSGGLDSILAALLVRRLGFDVTLLHVRHLFSADEAGRKRLQAAADQVGLPLRIVERPAEHLDTIRHPRHGYGGGMNPCVDCRIFMLKVAKDVMEEVGAEFVVTGEVLGQRPKSQHYRALQTAADESGLGDRLLRPLSANLLPDTLPVKKGWIQPDELLSIHGRSRETQIELAREFGVTDFPQPAGGCILIEKPYAARVRDAFSHYGKASVGVEQFELLRLGRHFRLSEQTKAIVGRHEEENRALMRFAPGRYVLEPTKIMGPTTLVEGMPSEAEIAEAARLTARYSDHAGAATVRIRVTSDAEAREIEVAPLASDDPRIREWRERIGPR